MDRKTVTNKNKITWHEVKKICHLTDETIEMAKKVGLTPRTSSQLL
ncbi:MAG: hypothetical protein HeimC3_50210 [Candidatus Heimdallarchaeota archaeon LC_3]|nr:MAG: hypothetical protein HeimC3_50210 [Candidatus Heimdallarchaeota archaeon LC_3]